MINHVVIFPLLPAIMAVFNKAFPPEPPAEAFCAEFLSEAMLAEPSVALYQVKRELLRLGPIVDHMLGSVVRLISGRDSSARKAIREDDDRVDTLRREIVAYLAKLARQSMTEHEGERQVAYLFIANELENLADVIDQNVLDRAKKLINRDLHFSDEGLEDVLSLCDMVSGNFRRVMEALESGDVSKAKAVLEESDKSWQFQRELRRKHFKRLNDGLKVSVETTEIHMDLLNDLHRINRHVYHIAQTLTEMSQAAVQPD
jgi:phosphate:Na+ symporter